MLFPRTFLSKVLSKHARFSSLEGDVFFRVESSDNLSDDRSPSLGRDKEALTGGLGFPGAIGIPALVLLSPSCRPFPEAFFSGGYFPLMKTVSMTPPIPARTRSFLKRKPPYSLLLRDHTPPIPNNPKLGPPPPLNLPLKPSRLSPPPLFLEIAGVTSLFQVE